MLFEEFNESCKVHGHLWYLSGMGEAFLSLFQRDPSNQLSAHDNIWFGGRCCLYNLRWLFSGWPTLISEWNNLSNFPLLFALKAPINFMLKRKHGLEMRFSA